MKVAVEVLLRAHLGEGDPPLETLLDRVMDELVALEVGDPAIGADEETAEVEVSLVVEAADLVDGLGRAASTIRAAIHAAEVSTPDWPRFDTGEVQFAIVEDRAPANA